MKTLRAIKALDYNGRRLRAGETFDASDNDSHVLTLAELATVVVKEVEEETKPAKEKKQRYKTRHMQAEDE